MSDALSLLAAEIHACERCPRLVEYRAESRAAHPEYWSRPVAGFGDPGARLVILGLAPGFHGANRHGRVFTGDDSGRWLWGALYALGVCSAENVTRGDQAVELSGVYISNAVRCVPPQNRPTGAEFDVCREYLGRELALLPEVRAVLALGKLAHDSYLKLRGVKLSAYPFAHGAVHAVPEPVLIDSYHPSRQNTNTGVLKWEMWISTIDEALRLADVSETQQRGSARQLRIPSFAPRIQMPAHSETQGVSRASDGAEFVEDLRCFDPALEPGGTAVLTFARRIAAEVGAAAGRNLRVLGWSGPVHHRGWEYLVEVDGQARVLDVSEDDIRTFRGSGSPPAGLERHIRAQVVALVEAPAGRGRPI